MIYKLPNLEPDFAKTQLYIIRCKDEAVPGCYVGATIDFNARRAQHKHAAANASANGGDNRKLYCTIRANGGFENYIMEVVDSYPECRSLTESRMREREIFDIYGGERALNTYRPHITDAERVANHRAADATWRANHKAHISEYEKRRYAGQRATKSATTTKTVKTTTTTTTETTETTETTTTDGPLI